MTIKGIWIEIRKDNKANAGEKEILKMSNAPEMTMKKIVQNGLTNHGIQGSIGDNMRLAQWPVKWLIEHSTSHQLLWCIDSFVHRNPPLRQALKRYGTL